MSGINGRPFEMEKEEDYSIALVDIFRDPDTISIYVNETNEKHHHTLTIE